MDAEPNLLDEAARAGWLYYMAGKTQDQIATELGISRQRAQRLVSRAMSEGLIHVRLEHKLAATLHLEAALMRRWNLLHCRVAPDLGPGTDPARCTATAAASLLEAFLARTEPLVLAFGTGRALSAMTAEIMARETPHHRVVSMIGNIAPDGSATFFDVILRISDKLRAPHYPMPIPLVSPTPAERALFHTMPPVQAVVRLAQSADVTFVGVGQMDDTAPLYTDGFLTKAQLHAMQAQGAIGEIVGGIYDAQGRYIETALSGCVGGVRVEPARPQPVIGIAAGPVKVNAIRAALEGQLINGLVTDESTATALLTQP